VIPLGTWLLFVAASIALAATPGPNLVYLMSRTLVQGRSAGYLSLAGTVTGLAVHVLAAAFGLSALLLAVPMAYDVVRIAGAAYLAWLAWQTWRSTPPPGERAETPAGHWRLWRDGVATGVLNPKVALFQLALFPQFVDPAHGSVLAQGLVLAATQVVVVALFDGFCVTVAGALRGAVSRTSAWTTWSRRVLAGMFGGLAVRLLLERR